LQRIFSQNKAEDAVKPLWFDKDDNAVMRKIDAKRRVILLASTGSGGWGIPLQIGAGGGKGTSEFIAIP
jgi:hypothetical protein